VSSFALANIKDIEEIGGRRLPGIEGRYARRHVDSETLIAVGSDRPPDGDGVLLPNWWTG
jgi:hypothetical protein